MCHTFCQKNEAVITNTSCHEWAQCLSQEPVMKIGFVFCHSPESGVVCDYVFPSGPPLSLSAGHLGVYLRSALAGGTRKPECCWSVCVRACGGAGRGRAHGERPLAGPVMTLSSCPSHLLTFSNHWKEKTARIVLSTASPATEACTRRRPATAHRCSPSAHPRRAPLPTRPTALGRKSQTLLKSGPSPGACMKTDVSSTLAAVCLRPHLGASASSWGFLKRDVSMCRGQSRCRVKLIRAAIESSRYSWRLHYVLSSGRGRYGRSSSEGPE